MPSPIIEPTDFPAFLQALSAGDETAWQRFIAEFHGLISSVAGRIAREYSEDIVQEVYFGIIKDHFKLIRQFRGDSRPAFLVYLRKIAENLGKNYRRKQFRRETEVGEFLAEIIDERPNPEAVMLADTDLQQMNEAIKGLRQDYRDVLNLLLKGFRHREIATILDIPLATSLTRANRAVLILKKVLKIEINPRPENILS